MSVAQLSSSRSCSGAFKASARTSCRYEHQLNLLTVLEQIASALLLDSIRIFPRAAAPLPSVLQAIGTEKITSKALWERLQAEPAEFKSRTYMKTMVEHTQKKNWVRVKFDGTMFVYYLTDLGVKKLNQAAAEA